MTSIELKDLPCHRLAADASRSSAVSAASMVAVSLGVGRSLALVGKERSPAEVEAAVRGGGLVGVEVDEPGKRPCQACWVVDGWLGLGVVVTGVTVGCTGLVCWATDHCSIYLPPVWFKISAQYYVGASQSMA